MNPIDMIFDENNTDPIVLYNEAGEAVSFEQVALIPMDGQVYVILKPTQMEGVAEDEALVFVVTEEDDEDVIMVVEDPAIIDAVFAEYYDLLAENGVV